MCTPRREIFKTKVNIQNTQIGRSGGRGGVDFRVVQNLIGVYAFVSAHQLPAWYSDYLDVVGRLVSLELI